MENSLDALQIQGRKVNDKGGVVMQAHCGGSRDGAVERRGQYPGT